MKGELHGKLTYVRKTKQYTLRVWGFILHLGVPDRKFRGKKRFLLPGYTLVDVETFIEEFGIVIRNEAMDRELDELFELMCDFRGNGGDAALVIGPCDPFWGSGYSSVRLAYPEEVTERLEIP